MAELSSSLRLLLPLLRSALWDIPLPEEDIAALKAFGEREWGDLVLCAKEQTVTGLLYLALGKLPKDVGPSDAIILSLLAEVNRIVLRNRRMWAVEDRICSEFSSSGLNPLSMKGRTCAMRYPSPELRAAGDIDLYFAPAEFDAAVDYVRRSGADVRLTADGSATYCIDGVDIDLHSRYFDLFSKEALLPPVPSPEAEVLMLSAHILKHAVGPGVGLRQICDFALALRSCPSVREKLESLFEKLGLGKWHRLLLSFITEYIDPSAGVYSADPRPLYRIVSHGGNFGHYAPSRINNAARHPLLSKADTFTRMILRLPFSLKFAPLYTLSRFKELL